ncbi:MAG: hypothetical protein LBU32_16060 [Clostridiales bacterium]|nr:hypothetical protein [Clostridiales bacterium]
MAAVGRGEGAAGRETERGMAIRRRDSNNSPRRAGRRMKKTANIAETR